MVAKPQEQEAELRRAGNRGIPVQASPASRTKVLIPALFVAFPPILFYTILLRKALDIPYHDDYYVLLDFLNQSTRLKTIPAKAAFFLAWQHNEYKLFFLHAVAWLQFGLWGHIDFKILEAIGNGFIFLLGILLWKMFLPTHKDLATRLAFFIPVSWLLFQLQYWETLDWAMAGLQNIPVLVFSLGAIYLLVRGGPWAFGGASAFLVLAVGSSGNGLLIIPIGLLILALDRRYARVAGWLVVSAGCIAAYAFRYNIMSSQSSSHRSVFATFHQLSPAFVIPFIGSAGSIPFKPGSFLLGILLCVFFVYMASRGYIRRNPTVSWCILFLLLTAIGVAGLRSDLGLGQSLAPRYTIYSALFVIFAWFAIAEEFVQHGCNSLLNKNIFLVATVAAMLFSSCTDASGLLALEGRDRALVRAMTAYEHPVSPDSTDGPDILLPKQDAGTEAFKERAAFNITARAILAESIKLGVYRPPPL